MPTGGMGCAAANPALRVFAPSTAFFVWRWVAATALPCTSLSLYATDATSAFTPRTFAWRAGALPPLSTRSLAAATAR